MIITSHMQTIIQIYPCLLKLSHKQESVMDRQTAAITTFLYIPSPLSRGDNNIEVRAIIHKTIICICLYYLFLQLHKTQLYIL
jgi:hypothetical protein